MASPKIPLRVNKTTAEIPGALIATLKITVESMKPVFLARLAKSTVNLYDSNKIRISARIKIVKKSEKKISRSTPPSPSITEIVHVENE